MFAGMFVLGGAVVLALGLDTGSLYNDSPELALTGMVITMTVPMVAWMRHRGHGWPASWEMTAAMFVPTFLALDAVVGRRARERPRGRWASST